MKMIFISGLECGRLSASLAGLLMILLALCSAQIAVGQQDGVSLKLHGEIIPNNSLVDIEDILYTVPGDPEPTNSNGLHDQTLVCVTDLEDCCESPHTQRGGWYYPDGNEVRFDRFGATFRRNRGPNEVINSQRFYGSVRLWRKWSSPPGKGRFRCELPSAANSNTIQTLYANILRFSRVNPVNLLASGPGVAGNAFSLSCSATLIDPIPLPSNVPSPTFEWFFGPDGNASLPSGVIPTATLWMTGNIYSSTLQFSPVLNVSHAGKYTCRIGVGRLANSAIVSVNVVVVHVTPSGTPILGQNGYTLTCRVLVTDSICNSVTYQWIKNNVSTMQLQTVGSTLSFSPLRLSDAGFYTCYATISSPTFSNDITVMGSHVIKVQIPTPSSVMVSSSTPNPVRPIGSAVTLSCTVGVELSQAVDVPVTVNMVWTGPPGFMTSESFFVGMQSTINFTSAAMISSFEKEQSGVYICTATLNSTRNYTYVINSLATAGSIQVTIGIYLVLEGYFTANNSQVNTRSIGLSPNSSLQCITDRNPCCLSQDPRLGEWYLPNGELVQGAYSTTAFYRSRGDNGEVSLNRPSEVFSPSGQFCCQVPNVADINQTLCVIIGLVSIIPEAIGSPIAGEDYTLECSAGGAIATFEWLGPPDGKTPIVSSDFITVSFKSSTSQLQFRPLHQSHNGSYLCRVTTNEGTLSSEPIAISVNAPKISIQITESTNGAVPIAGEDYDLICDVLGAEHLNSIITYQWRKSNRDNSRIGTNSSTLPFTTLRVSDMGNYSCLVTIASNYLTENITAMTSQIIRVQIPTPSFISLRSSEADFIEIIGSDVTLTCSVELNPIILGSEIFMLTVETQLFRDGVRITALDGPTVVGTIFTYTTHLNAFGRNDFGKYNCTATIRPQPSLTYLIGTDMLSVTLSIMTVIPPPIDIRATQLNSSAPVEVSWSPPFEFNITGYRIFYGNGQNVLVPSVMIITSVGLKVNDSYDGQTVFLRSESAQIYSEIVNVTVENVGLHSSCDMATPIMDPCSCWREVGIAVGVVVCLAVIVITIICVVQCSSQVNIRRIGPSTNSSLQCITDRNPCCLSQDPRLGEWYLPNGELVQGASSTTAFYRSRGDNGEVSLNRPSEAVSPTGQFCCQVPNAANINQTLCVTIGLVSITEAIGSIAGKDYTLECSAGGATARFEWLGPPDGETPIVSSSFITINFKSSISQLQFGPLQQSHNGSYSCRTTTNEDTLSSEPIEISVNAHKISIQITESTNGTVPIAGQHFDLVCNVLGAEHLNPIITYQWRKNNHDSSRIGTNSSTLPFIPLRISDMGNYSCLVTIASNYLTGNITAMTSQIIRVQVPTPSFISLRSSEADFIEIIGSDVTLTCSVELNPIILGSEIFMLTVETQIFRDGVRITALDGPTVVGTIFTYTTQLNAFGRSDFGKYNCTATIRPQLFLTYLTGIDKLSDTLSIIVTAIPPPIGIRATQSESSAPVDVSWSPPIEYGSFNITGYRIFYGNGKNILVPSVMTITSVGIKVNEKYDGKTMFLRSESAQIYSEIVNVTVENVGPYSSSDTVTIIPIMDPCSCWREVGIAVGVVVCLVVIVITIFFVVQCLRKKSTNNNEPVLSENVAYKDVKLKYEEAEGDYENPTDIVAKPSKQWTDNEATIYSTTVCTSRPPASEYTNIIQMNEQLYINN